jgi:hypothetical protein
MAGNPKDSVTANLSSAWWRVPIYDPGPPWWFETVGEQIQQQLVLEQIDTQKILQVQLNSLTRQAELLSGKR